MIGVTEGTPACPQPGPKSPRTVLEKNESSAGVLNVNVRFQELFSGDEEWKQRACF